MRIETLNRIKGFAERPTAEELSTIMGQFDSVIEEEFLWISAINQNKVHIYELVIAFNKNYFVNRLEEIKDEEKYAQVHFRILRFLIEVSKSAEKTNRLFDHLNETTLNLIDLVNSNPPKNKQQILFFIADIVSELPLNLISDKHISFLEIFSLSTSVSYIGGNIIEHFIPRIVREGDGVLLYKVLDRLVFNIKSENYRDDSMRSGYDGYHVSQLLTSDKVAAISKLVGSQKLIELTVSKIEAIIEKVPYNFSHLGISTIEDSSQILDTNKYEFILVKFLRIQLEIQTVSNEIIQKFLVSKYGIFKRLAIYYLNKNYKEQKEVFWQFVSSNALIDAEIKHETFMLLRENADSITKDEVQHFVTALDNMLGIAINKELSEEEVKQYNALLAKEYLLAFEECKSEIRPIVDEKLKEFDVLAPWKISNPGYSMYFDRSIAIDKNREEYSESFNTTELPKYFDIAEGGFKDMQEREALKIVNRINYLLRSNVPFILKNQERLIKMGLENFNEIPSFFEKAWFDKVNIDWGEVFIFFGRVVDANYHKNPEAYQHFISYCAWFIRSTTKDDNYALEGKALEEAKNLCLKFLSLEIQNERLNKDPFFDILNSTDGKIYDATLDVMLRNARLNKSKDQTDKWYPDLKAVYTKILESGKQTDATIWSISMHLPQFGYLDMDWLRNHLNQIFIRDDNQLWLLAMQGYHKYCSQVYKVIYDMLLQKGHYDLALMKFKDDQQGTEDVFEHIVMAFVAGWKGSEIDNSESLINRTLQKGNRSQIHGLINFFLKNKNFPRSKMLELWKAILKSPAVEDKLVYNDLLLLFTNLQTVDSLSFELTAETLANITTNQVLHRLIHSLFEMNSGDPIYRAKVLLEIKENDFEGFYDRDRGFEKLALEVFKTDPVFGKEFTSKLIGKRLFNLLPIYNQFT